MQQYYINILLIFLTYSLSIHAKAIVKGSSNETLLVGQINGPVGGAARNLLGMMLSMNIYYNHSLLHDSLIPITNSTFPLHYSVPLDSHEIKVENIKNVYIVSTIWQPAYVHEAHVELPEDDREELSFTMRTIKYVNIRGEILHEKHQAGHELPGTHVKLELMEVLHDENDKIIDQVDFQCSSTKYPCSFEYWFDTKHIKAKVEYKLEAVIANRRLPARKSVHQKHQSASVITKRCIPANFTINPTVDTEINDVKIYVDDV